MRMTSSSCGLVSFTLLLFALVSLMLKRSNVNYYSKPQDEEDLPLIFYSSAVFQPTLVQPPLSRSPQLLRLRHSGRQKFYWLSSRDVTSASDN